MIKARHTYGAFLMARYCYQAKKKIRQTMSECLSSLFGIKYKSARKDDLTLTACGITMNELVESKSFIDYAMAKRHTDTIDRAEVIRCNKVIDSSTEHLKLTVKARAKLVIRFKCMGWWKPVLFKSGRTLFKYCVCERIATQGHVVTCWRLNHLWDEAAKEFGFVMGPFLLREIERPTLTLIQTGSLN